MKTLNEFKNEVAEEQGFNEWVDLMEREVFILITVYRNYDEYLKGESANIETYLNESANRYAAYMCEEQRKICAEHAKVEFVETKTPHINAEGNIGHYHYYEEWVVDKDSILQSPLATNKNK